MCSYNRVNNSYACQNSKTINGILKTELGFQGEQIQTKASTQLRNLTNSFNRVCRYRLGSPACWNRLCQCWLGRRDAELELLEQQSDYCDFKRNYGSITFR